MPSFYFYGSPVQVVAGSSGDNHRPQRQGHVHAAYTGGGVGWGVGGRGRQQELRDNTSKEWVSACQVWPGWEPEREAV